MKLIKKLGTRIVNGRLESWGEFLCPFDNTIVERRLNQGHKCQSCGCKRKELISEGNKGKIRTEEQKQRYSEAFKGKQKSEKHKENLSKSKIGKKQSEETRQKISEGNKGKKHTEETKQLMKKNSCWKDKKLSKETRQKIKENHANFNGNKNPNWNNGSSFEPYSPEFNKDLKQQILRRDNYVCQNHKCNINKDIDLHVHHIDYNKKNNIPENLITLCNSCHSKTNHKNKRIFFIDYYQTIMRIKTRGV